MNLVDDMFKFNILKKISALVGIYAGFKITKWVLNHFYELWYYSYIPGLKIRPFIGNALLFLGEKSKYFDAYLDVIKEFEKEKLIRIWIGTQPILIIHKADILDAVFNETLLDYKSFDYKLVEPWLGTGLLTSGKKWFIRRKQLTPCFHFDILKDFLVVMNEHAEILITNLKMSNYDEKVYLEPFLKACALDVICETAMGQSVYAQIEENSEYVKAVKIVANCVVVRGKSPWLWSDFIFNFSELGKKQNEALRILHGFTQKIIKEREEDFKGICTTNKKRIAFLDLLLDIRLKDPNSITLAEIQEEVDTFMFEGHDTVATSLNWICFNIAKHKDVQEKVRAELETIFGESNRHVTTDDFTKMVYLEQVLKESLRLHPSVAYIARAAHDDLKLDNYKIKKGCTLMISLYSINRDPSVFNEPEKFIPERFSPENNHSTLRATNPFVYIPFSAGKRNCIGQRFAMMELKVIMANILRNFSLECDQNVKDIKIYNELVLKSEIPILFKLKPIVKN